MILKGPILLILLLMTGTEGIPLDRTELDDIVDSEMWDLLTDQEKYLATAAFGRPSTSSSRPARSESSFDVNAPPTDYPLGGPELNAQDDFVTDHPEMIDSLSATVSGFIYSLA